MMVGIPASGKSTFAREIQKEYSLRDFRCEVLSSDEIRDELFRDEQSQVDNSAVFEVMRIRTVNYLKNGISVIYDATNISSKRRKALLKQLPKSVFKRCIYVPSTPSRSLKNQDGRDRKVPNEVIERMYRNLQVPSLYEGFDEIKYFTAWDTRELVLPKSYEEYLDLLREIGEVNCIDLPQDNPYHTLSVSRHMYYAYEQIKDCGNVKLAVSSLLHDIGKPYCKEFNGKYASFKGHENISAQKAIEILRKYGFSEEDTAYISTLIQLHMRMHHIEKESKAWYKLKEEVGEQMFENLMLLEQIDSLAK